MNAQDGNSSTMRESPGIVRVFFCVRCTNIVRVYECYTLECDINVIVYRRMGLFMYNIKVTLGFDINKWSMHCYPLTTTD